MTFRDVTPEWIISFREYLDKTARCRDKRKTITTDEYNKVHNTRTMYKGQFKHSKYREIYPVEIRR